MEGPSTGGGMGLDETRCLVDFDLVNIQQPVKFTARVVLLKVVIRERVFLSWTGGWCCLFCHGRGGWC